MLDPKGNQTPNDSYTPPMRTFQIENMPYNVINTDIHRPSLSKQSSNQTSPIVTNMQSNQFYKIHPTIDTNTINAPSTNIDIEIESIITDELKTEMGEIDDLIDSIHMDLIPITMNISPTSQPSSSATTLNKKNMKRKKKKPRKHNRYHDIGYDPNPMRRAQGNIQISKSLTESIVPRRVKENISNVYEFMDKSYALSLNMMDNDKLKVINYDLHDIISNQVLFCVMSRHEWMMNKCRGYKWRMMNKLFTAEEIMTQYGITMDYLPKTWRNTERFAKELIVGDNIAMLLMDKRERERIICRCQWHKVDIYNRVNNKRRMTLSVTKPEFMRQCRAFSNEINEINLIPILMFNKESNEYWIEHVWIVEIDVNIDIGVAFKYNAQNELRVSGIHLDKEYLRTQHQLVLPQHSNECRCLQDFKSSISDLKIGNPDDLQNKINYYRQVIDELSIHKEQMQEFMNIEANGNNVYKFRSLQQRLGKETDNEYVETQQKVARVSSYGSSRSAVTTANHSPLLHDQASAPHINVYDARYPHNAHNPMMYSRSPSYTINANHFRLNDY